MLAGPATADPLDGITIAPFSPVLKIAYSENRTLT